MPELHQNPAKPAQAKRPLEPITPHRVALAFLLCQVLGDTEDEYSSVFLTEIYKIVTAELFEIHERAATYEELNKQTSIQLNAEQARNDAYNEAAQQQGLVQEERIVDTTPLLTKLAERFSSTAKGCDLLQNLAKHLAARVNYTDDDTLDAREPLSRRSPLGLFCRSMTIGLTKLSFEDTTRLSKQVAEWISSSKTKLVPVERLNRRAAMIDTLDTRMQALETHQAAASAGDYSLALASLRKFYDYRFPKSGRGQHQHALLNLASYHYSTGGMEAARHAIEEAIKIARTEGDRDCLQLCMSLLHRISMETASSSTFPSRVNVIKQLPFSLSKIPPLVSAQDELWSVRLALDLGESIPNAFQRLYRALGRHELAVRPADAEKPAVRREPIEVGAWHATHAALWDLSGVVSVAELHEDLVDDTSSEDARLSVITSRAKRLASQGELDKALGSLLAPSAVQNMTMQAYHSWADTVWELVAQDARNRDDNETLCAVDSLRVPAGSVGRQGPGGPPRALWDSSASTNGPGVKLAQEEVRACLLQSRKLKRANAPAHIILPHLLAAVELADQLALWPLYRLATVMLAEVLASLDTAMAVREVGRVWTQIQSSGEKEALAIGAWVLGRAELEYALECDGLYDMAKSYLETALAAAEAIHLRSLQADVLALLALLPGVPDDEAEALAERWRVASEPVHDPTATERARKIGAVVRLVGVRIVEGWS